MIKLEDLPRELDAITWAARRLGYNFREVERRMESTKTVLAAHGTPGAHDVRQYLINMRGWDMPPQFATSQWLDLQLENLIDQLASAAETAEIAEIASRG